MPCFEDPHAAALCALQCLDLTSLKDDDSDATVASLVASADTPFGAPAAVCVYPAFVPAARRALDARSLTQVPVATVVNFPHGGTDAGAVRHEVEAALASGAQEIDAVFPWRALLAGDTRSGTAVVRAAREASAGRLLKVILETGELHEPVHIRQAADIALAQGADFLKTSTGKARVHATPQAVAVLLQALRAAGPDRGLKVSGGLATLPDVQRCFALAQAAFGAAWIGPRHLRFGASGLLKTLLAVLRGQGVADAAGAY